MPLYDFRCKFCGMIFEEYIKADSGFIPDCPRCGLKDVVRDYRRQRVNVQPDIEPSYNFSLGEYVTSRRDLREKLAYNNAYSPDIPRGNPTDGVLTREERMELEGRRDEIRPGTILDKRRKGEVVVDNDIIVEGEADYGEITRKLRERHEKVRGGG